jgi:cation-transporting ATPase E
MVSAAEISPAAAAGLTSAEARRRRDAGQSNDYEPTTSRSVTDIVRANVFTRFNALLGSMLVVILVVGPLQDALFGLTILANTVVGVVQELRAKHTLDRLSVVSAPRVAVLRDGAVTQVASADVVLEDVVAIGAGDEVVVDGVVLDAQSLSLDESLLTGESHAVPKYVGDTVLSGSTVVAGSGRFVVSAVGENSYAARLTAEARRFALAPSELRDGVNRILQVITWVLVPTAILLIWSQFSREGTFADAVRGSVAGTVTMVPEGLVLLTSIAFAVGGIRLARRKVLPRELASVEGLARVDVLCIDKTGTLTTGTLVVADLKPVPGVDAGADASAALGLLARLEERPNATARALADRFPAPIGRGVTRSIPFSSDTKWMAADLDGRGWWVLGAPDVLLASGHPVLRTVEELAAAGMRVLVVGTTADAEATGGPHVQPVAIVTLVDELRADAVSTLDYLAREGVTVKVVSGDHPATVAALVRRLGIDPGEPLDARRLPTDPAAIAQTVAGHTVLGRVTPEQKREVVRALQRAGHVVAMTGDGVNDVLALKEADVGMAMGSGVPAARAVSQLVLLDDSFTAVPDVIAEGRRVIANMERVANLFVTKTVYAALLALSVGVARLPFPFLPRHLTIVSTLTIGVPAFFLALAPNDRRARPHFVARVARFALPAGIVAAGATYLAYTQARDDSLTTVAQSRTLATIVLLAVGLWILAILVRLGDDRQRWIVPVMGLGFLVAVAFEPMRVFFALELPRSLVLLAGVGAAALSGLALELGWQVAGWLRPVGRRLRDAAAAEDRQDGNRQEGDRAA